MRPHKGCPPVATRLASEPGGRVLALGGESELPSWVDDDFVDPTFAHPSDESDPWAPNRTMDPTSGSSLSEPLEAEPEASFPHDAEDFLAELTDLDPTEPWAIAELDPSSDWAEPEPRIDASSELSESLYPQDDSITDISRELKIGELLARVEPMTSSQRERCHALLAICATGRLRRWIPWLRNRHWSGTKLQLFLEFRLHWESNVNVRWWETFRWDYHQQEWIPRYQSAAMTLDHGRELVERRPYCGVADMIDPVWFAEWEGHAAWELGVLSFASFVVFRAGVPDGEDWRGQLARHDRRTRIEAAQCADRRFAPFMLPSFAQQYGFSRGLTTASDHPWFDVVDTGHRKAAAAHGDLARSWQDLIGKLTGL